MLARVDERLWRRQADIDDANPRVARAQAEVADSMLAAAHDMLSGTEFDLQEKQRDYQRAEELVKTDAVSVR